MGDLDKHLGGGEKRQNTLLEMRKERQMAINKKIVIMQIVQNFFCALKLIQKGNTLPATIISTDTQIPV